MNELSKKPQGNEANTLLAVRSFRIGNLVKFNTVSDDSDYASNCFGVEPQNDWFDVQVYTVEVFGEVVQRNTIQIIYPDGSRSGKLYRIVNGIVESEVEKLFVKKKQYGMKLSDIFEGSNLRTMKDFETIEIIKFIPLKKAYQKKYCLLAPPKKPSVVSIWNKSNTGYTYGGKSFYDNGKWIENNTKEENTRIDEFSKWEISLDRIYINRKIFVEDSGL